MGEKGPDKPGGRKNRNPYIAAHPEFTGRYKPSPPSDVRGSIGLLDRTPAPNLEKSTQQSVERYFQGREKPKTVMAYRNTRYYPRLDAIPSQDAKDRRRDHVPNAEGFELETRENVALDIYTPPEGKPEESSFKFVGDRLYVRVKRIKQTEEGKNEITSWIRFNEDGTPPEKVIYT